MIHSKNFLRILYLILDYKKALYLAVCAMVVMALTQVLLPFIINQGLLEVLVDRSQDSMKTLVLVIVGLVSIRSLASYLYLYVTKKLCANVCSDLRVALFNKLFVLPAGQFGLNQYNLPVRFIRDINLATETVMRIITILVKDVLTVVGLTACMFYLNWELALFIMLAIPPIILIMQYVSEQLDGDSSAVTQSINQLTKNIKRAIQQLRVIQLYRGQSNICAQFQKKAEQLHAAELKPISFHALIIAAGQLIVYLVILAVVVWAIQMVYRDDVTLTELFALSVSVLLMISPLHNISRISSYLEQSEAAVDRVFSILDCKDGEVKQGDISIRTIDGQNGSLTLERVSVSSGEQKEPILIDVNLAIKPGEVTAVVNTTYSERQVIIDLMLGMRSPSTGKVQLDGYNIETIKQSDLFDHFSIISPDEVLLDETIAANIAYGVMHAASESEIVAAAHAALAMNFIREMPNGLQTRVGEGGQQLTLVQIQQLAIARALLKSSTLLILNGLPDHTTSSTDPIFLGLNALMRNRSTLVFTGNRLILEKANRIVVFDNGSVVETGAHQNLLDRQGKYAQITQARSETSGVSGVAL